MGRWFVIVLAVLAALALLAGFFPGMLAASLTIGKMSITWGILIAAALLIAFNRLSA